MKKSLLALLLLLALGGATYWMQDSALVKSMWSSTAPVAASATTDSQAATAQKPGNQGQPAGQGGSGKRPALAVELAASTTEQISDDIAAIGTLVSDESADIAAETNGRITEIGFAEGASVKTGDVLFRLDDALAQAVLNDVKAKLELARTVFNRNRSLLKSRTIPQSQADTAATDLALAESAVALAEVQLAKLTIRAPFAGRTGFRTVSVGAYVQAGTPLVHLEKIDVLKAAFSVPELQYTQLRQGQTVQVTADAVRGEEFTATIAAIDPLVDESGRALKLRATLDNSADKLRPGMLIRVRVKGPERTSVFVPEAALVPRGDGSVVFAADDTKAREVKVTTGKRRDGNVEILDGLKGGEMVVVAGNTRLSDGAAINPVKTAQN